MRVHIKNNRMGQDVFRITREHFDGACARHPEIAAEVDATIDWDLDRFDESMAAADILVTWDLPTESLAERAPNLKFIHIIGAGVEHLQPLDWLPPGVSLINNKGVHAEKAGEFGLMALLMLNNAMPAILTNQRNAVYEEIFSTAIAGKTLLVVGLGHMGKAVARQAMKIGLRVVGISRSGAPAEEADAVYGPEALDRLLPEADFVLVTAPHTSETHGLFDRRRLGLMKSDAGLINMSRAQVIDYAALSDCLSAGGLAGAVLDVFDPEPLPATSPLWTTPNLVLTPHVSSDDRDAYVPLTLDLVFGNIRRILDGRPLQNVVHPDLGY